MLGINCLKSINPLIDWCSGKVYLPNAVYTALLEGKWLSAEHTIGTVRILSDSTGLNNVREDQMKNFFDNFEDTTILDGSKFEDEFRERGSTK